MKLASAQRKTAAELVIGLAICGAAYYFLVQPLKRELFSLRAQSQTAASKAPVATPPDPAKVASLIENIRAKCQTICQRGEIARSEAAMFSQITQIASRFSIQIDELRVNTNARPGSTVTAAPPPGAGNPAQPPDPAIPVPPKDTRTAYEFAARGSYPNVAAFLSALGSDLGYAVVRDVRISPPAEASPDQISVTVRTEHFAFDVGAVSALVDAQPASAPSGGGAPK